MRTKNADCTCTHSTKNIIQSGWCFYSGFGFLFFFCFGFLYYCHCNNTPLHLHPYIRCYIPLHSVTSNQQSYFSGFWPTHSVYSTFFALSSNPVSDSILAKDITLDRSKAWICFSYWSRHVYFISWLDDIGEFRCSMAEIASHYDYVLTFLNYSLSSECGLLVSSSLIWNTANWIFDGNNH